MVASPVFGSLIGDTGQGLVELSVVEGAGRAGGGPAEEGGPEAGEEGGLEALVGLVGDEVGRCGEVPKVRHAVHAGAVDPLPCTAHLHLDGRPGSPSGYPTGRGSCRPRTGSG